MVSAPARRAILGVLKVRLALPVPPGRQSVGPTVDRIGGHLRTPLYRNAYALILSTGLTSGLGFVYWLAAARLYPAEVVGLNSAALSALMFLAGLAQFNLANVLVRFIPRAGTAALSLNNRATLVTVVAGLLAGLVFVLGIDIWTPSLAFLLASPLLVGGFAMATAAWGVFVLQEGALTGLRRATWVPVRNAVFALGKIALLFLFSSLLPDYGMLASWIIAAVLLLGPTGWLVRRQLAAGLPAAPRADDLQMNQAQILRYAAADYAGSLAWLAATMLVPVLVSELEGPAATAHFYLAWTIAYSLYLVAPGMGSSLIVESALDPESLGAYSRKALLQTARLVLPLVVVLVLVAPYVLRLLGDSYAVEGTTLVRLLALSAIPNVVNALAISVARAQRQIVAIVGILVAQCVSVLVLSFVLLQSVGIVGVGLAWLVSQSAVAAVLLVLRGRLLQPAARPSAL